MSQEFDMRLYKMSCVIVNDLEKSIKILDKVIPEVYTYRRYSPMKIVYITMLDQKKYMEQHLEKYKKIKEKKGRVK